MSTSLVNWLCWAAVGVPLYSFCTTGLSYHGCDVPVVSCEASRYGAVPKFRKASAVWPPALPAVRPAGGLVGLLLVPRIGTLAVVAPAFGGGQADDRLGHRLGEAMGADRAVGRAVPGMSFERPKDPIGQLDCSEPVAAGDSRARPDPDRLDEVLQLQGERLAALTADLVYA